MVAWALTCSAISGAAAQGAFLHVRGTSRLQLHAARDKGDLVLRGALLDDTDKPIGGETAHVRIEKASEPLDASVLEGLRAAKPCDLDTVRHHEPQTLHAEGSSDAPVLAVTTDNDGRFCFRARLTPDRYVAHVTWRGTNLVDATEQQLDFDLTRQALVLRFDPRPRIVMLDARPIQFEATALVEDDDTTRAKEGLALVLTNESGTILGHATTDLSGRARFSVNGDAVGNPGRGTLQLSFVGDAQTAFATHVADIERHVTVRLSVPALEKLEPQVPEEGIELVVNVESTAGVVAEGAVEARMGEIIVGAAPVQRGSARLHLRFAPQEPNAIVRLRYVSTSPWYEPHSDETIRLPVRGPSIFSKLPPILAGIAVLAFFLGSRIGANRSPAGPSTPPTEANIGLPRLDVVSVAKAGEFCWRGRVVDAHDGTPVRDAQAWIERGTFNGSTVLARANVDWSGNFDLPRTAALERLIGDERIVVEGRLHSRFAQSLPSPGELVVALVLRRRTLLRRLVMWARRRGQPFDGKPEATPGHVRRNAGDDGVAAHWAEAVEIAAFGRGEVDALAEQRIEQMAPPDAKEPVPDSPVGAPKPSGGEEEHDQR